MERFGIVGLPNAGKSSLFNALTGGNAAVAAHPFSTTETNVGVAKVPDHRLVALAEMSASKKVVEATAEFADIAGIQKGSNAGEGLGNKFLGGIREVDAILYVLRAFEDPNVVGGNDPLDDLATLELELVLADAASAETQLERRRKAAKQDKSLAGEVAALERAVDVLQSATPLYRASLTADERAALQPVLPAHRQADPRRRQRRRGSARGCRRDRRVRGDRAGRRRRSPRRVRAARSRGRAARRRRAHRAARGPRAG